MRDDPTHPGRALVALPPWGAAGKLDEPIEGFDPERAAALGDTAQDDGVHRCERPRRAPRSASEPVVGEAMALRPLRTEPLGRRRRLAAADRMRRDP